MLDNIERHNELSKKVLIQDGEKPPVQKTSSPIQISPMQLIQPFSLGAILGFALFVLIWVFAGFSKIAIAAPFLGGVFGIMVEMMRKKNKI